MHRGGGNSRLASHNQDFSLIEAFNNLALWGEKKFVSELKRTYKFQRRGNNILDCHAIARSDVKRHTEDNSPKYRMVGEILSILRSFAVQTRIFAKECNIIAVGYVRSTAQDDENLNRLRNKCAMTWNSDMEENNFTDKVFSRFTSLFSLKRPAFTLAEVLITLGIIGVVAALTLPTLISNYKKQTYVTGLQKAYSVLNNMTKEAMAKDDVTNFLDTQLMQAWSEARGASCSKCENFETELKKSFPNAELLKQTESYPSIAGLYLEKIEGKSPTPSRDDTAYHLYKNSIFTTNYICLMNQDSILYCFMTYGGYGSPADATNSIYEDFANPVNFPSSLVHILVDVNGYKKPNQLGRDFFVFSIGARSGRVVPAGSMAINDDFAKAAYRMSCSGAPAQYQAACKNSIVESLAKSYEQTTQANYYCFNTEAQKKPEGNNLYCADKIIKEGWKMNY